MAKKTRAQGSTPATVALERARIPFTAHPYEHDPSAHGFGIEAAEALGVDERRVFKTLVVDSGVGLAVGVVPVSAMLDLKAMASALDRKRVHLAAVADAERSSGYVHGGISPIGQRKALPTVVDESALGFPTVFVSGGRRGFDIELAPGDLVRAADASVAGIAATAD